MMTAAVERGWNTSFSHLTFENSPMNGPVSGLRLVFIVRELHVQYLVLCLCGRVNS